MYLMNAVTSGTLKVNSMLNICEILEFDMEIKKNCHTIARITGYVPDEMGESPILQKLEESSLSVTKVDGSGSEKSPPVFFGFIKTAEVWQQGNGYIAKIEAISSTEVLDHEEKNRSFQNVDMTYKELIRSVLSNTENAQVIFHIEDQKIGIPVYQYRETDWEFLKRIAGQLGTSLYAGGISLKPELYFGLPVGNFRKGEEIRPEKIWFDKSYYIFDKEKYHFTKHQFICHEISSYEDWKVGDRISMPDGREMVVVSKRCKLEKGLLVYYYTVASSVTFVTARYDNPKMAGVSLAGTVLETKQENVRVNLDMDGEQSSKEGFWYPWMPETGNVMYCMPEIGERIMITFDDGEGSARGSRGVRKNGTGNGDMQEPSSRYFTTVEDKRMYILPDSLGFVDLKQKVPLKVGIHDGSGADIESSREVAVLAKAGVWLGGHRVSFQAPQEISIVRRDMASPTVINMCNGFDSIGKYGKVKMEGSGDAVFPALDSYDTDTYDLKGTENAVIASTPCAAGSTELERQITGAKVDVIRYS